VRASTSRSILSGVPRLQLTSLVDMMVILVVFLLQSFSAEGQLMTPASGLELPASSSQTPVRSGLVIEIGPEWIQVAGLPVLTTSSLDDPGQTEVLDRALNRVFAASGLVPVLVQADRRLDYGQLSRVLASCAGAGWKDVSLVVLEGGS
jgi:biopolymer transport protein ExbD